MWLTIDKLHEHVKGRQMFVARAFDVGMHGKKYTTDPWCVWLEPAMSNPIGPNSFIRWPHMFMPTHFCLLPEERE